MLLAPMLFDDAVLGVLVLTKLGLDQFMEDDLRLLEIYASFAAQAFSNAEVTERLEAKSAALERQLKSQHDLLSITESILTTLDPHRVLEQVADRLSELVGYENLVIEVVDPVSDELRPLTARGSRAAWLLKPNDRGEAGIASWVTEHRQGVLLADGGTRAPESGEDSLHPASGNGARHPTDSLIAVPLRGRTGPRGVLVLERGDKDNRYTQAEFELVQLFAAQVSIALQNAENFRAVEIRAATDDLTGLFNHGTFEARLESQVAKGTPFSLIMLDLDEFKNVNDELGHQAGDRLLAEIARALEAASREVDEIFRYGGEEFTIILPNADANGALRVANRVLASVCALGAAGSRWSRRGVSISASLGVATFPDDGFTAAEVLLAADRACQVSKRNGRARISTALDGLALSREFTLTEPTPVDPAGVAAGS
jgi:diguanylate cyclase (GGDEF)-like protein